MVVRNRRYLKASGVGRIGIGFNTHLCHGRLNFIGRVCAACVKCLNGAINVIFIAGNNTDKTCSFVVSHIKRCDSICAVIEIFDLRDRGDDAIHYRLQFWVGIYVCC